MKSSVRPENGEGAVGTPQSAALTAAPADPDGSGELQLADDSSVEMPSPPAAGGGKPPRPPLMTMGGFDEPEDGDNSSNEGGSSEDTRHGSTVGEVHPDEDLLEVIRAEVLDGSALGPEPEPVAVGVGDDSPPPRLSVLWTGAQVLQIGALLALAFIVLTHLPFGA